MVFLHFLGRGGGLDSFFFCFFSVFGREGGPWEGGRALQRGVGVFEDSSCFILLGPGEGREGGGCREPNYPKYVFKGRPWGKEVGFIHRGVSFCLSFFFLCFFWGGTGGGGLREYRGLRIAFEQRVSRPNGASQTWIAYGTFFFCWGGLRETHQS